MERVQVLIDKLMEQQKQQESPAQLLMTVQLLQQELLQMQQQTATKSSAKVAVVMPYVAMPLREAVENKVAQKGFENVAEQPAAEKVKPLVVQQAVVIKEEVKPAEPAVVEKPVDFTQPSSPYAEIAKPAENKVEEPKQPPIVEQPQKASAENNGYALRRPQVTVQQEVNKPEEVKPEPQVYFPAEKEAAEEVTYFTLTPTEPEYHPFDAVTETPTLLQHTGQKEVNQVLGSQHLSLNDRLKQEKKEIAHKLVDTPIKDLRKAIGINDRFLFVDELFRGDDSMYERSIKTINNFHILPEAEYWINRELKVKLGWNDNKDTVQHFYHLVRRRFS